MAGERMTDTIGPLTIPATAKLRPGDMIRVSGHGSWDLIEQDELITERDQLRRWKREATEKPSACTEADRACLTWDDIRDSEWSTR